MDKHVCIELVKSLGHVFISHFPNGYQVAASCTVILELIVIVSSETRSMTAHTCVRLLIFLKKTQYHGPG